MTRRSSRDAASSDRPRETHEEAINAIARSLRTVEQVFGDELDRVRCYGSVMRDDPEVHDVDLCVDLDTPMWRGRVVDDRPTDAGGRIALDAARPQLAPLLVVVRAAGGAREAPYCNLFVRTAGRLVMPTSDRWWWRVAPQGAGVWEKALSRGIGLPLLSPRWRARIRHVDPYPVG